MAEEVRLSRRYGHLRASRRCLINISQLNATITTDKPVKGQRSGPSAEAVALTPVLAPMAARASGRTQHEQAASSAATLLSVPRSVVLPPAVSSRPGERCSARSSPAAGCALIGIRTSERKSFHRATVDVVDLPTKCPRWSLGRLFERLIMRAWHCCIGKSKFPSRSVLGKPLRFLSPSRWLSEPPVDPSSCRFGNGARISAWRTR